MSQLLKIGVIGAGNMGGGIAQKIAQEGLNVVLIDIRQEFVEKGLATIKSLLQAGVDRKVLTPQKAEETLSRITGGTDFRMVSDADIVVEAVFEDKAVKGEVFEKLAAVCEAHTIFATNTSSFYVRELAERSNRPDRFIGLHYFYHPAKNRLLEVIPHAGTSPETLDAALRFAGLHGKTAITVKDSPGFVVNRFFVPYLNEAVRMLEEKVADIPTIEAAAKTVFQLPIGPFELMNVSGIPIAVHAADTLSREIGPFYATAPMLRAQMEKKEFWPLSGPVDDAKIARVSDRLLGVCLGVAATLVEEGVASKEDTDRGAKIGLRWAEGPFELMNRIGMTESCRLVEAISEKHPDFKVPEILTRQRLSGKPFEFDLVDLKIKKDTAFITINRPEAMNALNETVVGQLTRKFSEAEENAAVQAIVIQGAGKAFIAGADIRFFIEKIKAGRISDIETFTRKGHELLLKIENSKKKTIALLDGLSLGGGSELALACHQILATPAGSMGFPETGIGIFPGLGGMLRFAKQVGTALAKYYTFTGAGISAAEAHALGVVTVLASPTEVPAALSEMISGETPEKYRDRELPAQFIELAKTCGQGNIENLLSGRPLEGVSPEVAARVTKSVGFKAPIALRMANEIIDRQAALSIKDGIELESSRLKDIFSTADALEGLLSNVERRRPKFTGA